MNLWHFIFTFFIFFHSAFAETWVPEGFSDLSDEELSELSVYYNNEYIGEVIAEFDSNYVKILNSSVLEKKLAPYLVDDYVVFNLLGTKLPSNIDLVCKDRLLGGVCPYLVPKIVGLILDRGEYRIDLYIAPQYLTRSSISRELYYNLPSFNEWVYSSRFTSHALGNRMQALTKVLNEQYLSRGHFSVYMNLTYNHDLSYINPEYSGDVFLNNLNFNYEKARKNYMFGFIPAQGTEYTVSGNIFGFGLTTIDRHTNNTNGLVGTPFSIDISVPSLVTYYVNGQIVDSRSYDTGIHDVDLTQFPNGSYQIKAVIHDINGDVSTKDFPFIKSSVDPLVGYPEYGFYLGVNRGATAEIYPKISNEFFLTMNYAYRYNRKLALYFESGWQDNSFLLGVSPGFYWRRHQYLKPSVAYDTKSGFLYSFMTQNRWRGVNIGLFTSKVKSGLFDTDEVFIVNLGYELGRYGALSVNYSNANSFEYSYSISRNKRISFPKSWKRPFKFDVQVGYSNKRSFLRVGTAKHIVKTKKHNGLLRSNLKHGSDQESLQYDQGLGYDFDYDYSKSLSFSAAANLDDKSVSINSRIKKRIKNNVINVQNTILKDFSGDLRYMYDTSLARNDAFGFVVSRHGAKFLGKMATSAGVIASVEGIDNNKDVIITAMGREFKVDAQNQSTFIPLPLYKSYKLTIDYRGDQAFYFEGGEDEIMLFPGNIGFIKFKAKPVFTLFSSFSCAGMPFANKPLFSSVDTVVTDSEGFASIEVAYDDLIQVYGSKNQGIGFSTQGLVVEDGFVYLDSLVCSQGEDILKANMEADAKAEEGEIVDLSESDEAVEYDQQDDDTSKINQSEEGSPMTDSSHLEKDFVGDYLDVSSPITEASGYPYNSPDMFFIDREQELKRIAEEEKKNQSVLSIDGSADESKQDVVDDVNAVLPTDMSSDESNAMDDGDGLPIDESVDVSSEADLSDIDPKIDDSPL